MYIGANSRKERTLEVPELVINMAGEEFTLTEFNTWVCIFTEVPAYDHLYVHAPSVFAVFECRKLLTQLMHLGFPMQVRRLPTPWDLSAYDAFIEKQLAHLDEEIDELEGDADEPGVD